MDLQVLRHGFDESIYQPELMRNPGTMLQQHFLPRGHQSTYFSPGIQFGGLVPSFNNPEPQGLVHSQTGTPTSYSSATMPPPLPRATPNQEVSKPSRGPRGWRNVSMGPSSVTEPAKSRTSSPTGKTTEPHQKENYVGQQSSKPKKKNPAAYGSKLGEYFGLAKETGPYTEFFAQNPDVVKGQDKIEEYVTRPTSKRKEEVNSNEAEEVQRDEPKRPMNSFMLYRKIYNEIAAEHFKTNQNHIISALCGYSWNLESPEVKARFKALAERDEAGLRAAFPDYRYTPKNTANNEDKKGPTHAKQTSSKAVGKKRAREDEDDNNVTQAPIVSKPQKSRMDMTAERPRVQGSSSSRLQIFLCREKNCTHQMNLSDEDAILVMQNRHPRYWMDPMQPSRVHQNGSPSAGNYHYVKNAACAQQYPEYGWSSSSGTDQIPIDPLLLSQPFSPSGSSGSQHMYLAHSNDMVYPHAVPISTFPMISRQSDFAVSANSPLMLDSLGGLSLGTGDTTGNHIEFGDFLY